MALESFYGGKQGVSPVIKASFEYVSKEDPAYTAAKTNGSKITKAEAERLKAAGIKNTETNTYYVAGETITWNDNLLAPLTMDECFKRVDYTDVWYGELCIIDTQNKLNPNNGKIFRRTLKRYKNPEIAGLSDTDALYAEYIGQIVGPSGGVPNLDLGGLKIERQKAVGAAKTYSDDGEIPLDTTEWDYAYINKDGNMTHTNPQGNYANIKVFEAGGINGKNIEMVPGKDDNNNYHNTIKYTWCNVRRNLDHSDKDAWIYLGFQIPYTVYDVSGQGEDYTYNEEIFVDNSSTPNQGENYHPFYKEYTFHIPRGARGIGPQEIFVVGRDKSLNQNDEVYSFNDLMYENKNDNTGNDRYYLKNNAEPLKNLPETYWVAKYKLFNPKTTEKPEYYFYIGTYKDIKFIRVETDKTKDDYGQMYVTYSDNSKAPINNKLPLPKNISYNNDGTLKFTMADGATITTSGTIKELYRMQVGPDGTIYVQYSTDEKVDFDPNNLNWHNIGAVPIIDASTLKFTEVTDNTSNNNIFVSKLKFEKNIPTGTTMTLSDFWSEKY